MPTVQCTGCVASISIHALREEGDECVMSLLRKDIDFYPRPPRGGRRPRLAFWATAGVISIHALREEGDRWPRLPTTASGYFYPRPPRGGRPQTGGPEHMNITNFYPRPPRGGRPGSLKVPDGMTSFLSTPSARRATPHPADPGLQIDHFYPRPPRGGRPRCAWMNQGA